MDVLQDGANQAGYAARPLTDASLVSTSGGKLFNSPVQITIDGSATQCGEQYLDSGTIIYRPCPRCNKPMHTEWYVAKWYCDPCNFSEFRPREEVWYGSEESLIAAAR